MNSWILSIVGIVCFGVIIDIFIPEGQINKYIKSIFSLLIVFVIISPLPNLLNGNFSFENILNNFDSEVDLNFLSNINKNKKEEIEKIIKESLLENEIDVPIEVNCNYLQEEFEILNIFIDITNVDKNQQENIRSEIIKIIQKNININKEKIIFNE